MTLTYRFLVLPTLIWILSLAAAVCYSGETHSGNNAGLATGEDIEAAEVHKVRLRWGMTLGMLLRKNKIPADESQQIVQALRQVFNPRKLRAGDTIELAHDPGRKLVAICYQPAPDLRVKIYRDTTGVFVARADTLPTVTETSLLVGEIKSTLYEAVLQAGESPELIMAFSDIFQWDIDFFTDPRKGDRFYILFEKEFLIDPAKATRRFLRYGPILAAAYAKHDTTLQAFSVIDEYGLIHYYDREGKSFQKTFLKSPLNYRRISSYFTRRRRHPILKRVRAHTGVDFAAPKGTPVVASADGKIIHKGWNGGYGRCLKISHKNGAYVTLYGHLSGYARGLQEGSHVKQGQLIGFVGATGLASGPHLHYAMYQNGKPINPLRIRPASGKPLPAEQFPAFARRRDSLLFRLGLQSENPAYAAFSRKYAIAR